MKEFLLGEETYQILGACFEVYKNKGSGFLEPVYQECLEIEFNLRRIPYLAKSPIQIVYKGHTLKHRFQADFLCMDQIMVEIKAVSRLADEHRAQLLNYLNAAECQVGLLVNFGHHPKVEHERFVNTLGPAAR